LLLLSTAQTLSTLCIKRSPSMSGRGPKTGAGGHVFCYLSLNESAPDALLSRHYGKGKDRRIFPELVSNKATQSV